jgi:hypothetical protein
MHDRRISGNLKGFKRAIQGPKGATDPRNPIGAVPDSEAGAAQGAAAQPFPGCSGLAGRVRTRPSIIDRNSLATSHPAMPIMTSSTA